jgi:integrase
MARRRFQQPTPFKEGKWWWIIARVDYLEAGKLKRKNKRMKLGPVTMLKREAEKIASEKLRPMNQGLELIGSVTLLKDYVESTYKKIELPLLADSTQKAYLTHLNRYVLPKFGEMSLREMTPITLQRYFSGLAQSEEGPATVLKIKETLSSILGSAKKYELLAKNPMEGISIPHEKVLNRKKRKPTLSVQELDLLLTEMKEPYATMVNTAYFSGLRPSELNGLKIEDLHEDSITLDESCCRGNWKETKTDGSSATISIPPDAIERICRLKDLTVEYSCGGRGAKRRVKCIRSLEPTSLIFQSLHKGGPMNDGNIRNRHIRPAAVKLGIDPKKTTWQAFRRSYLTNLADSGATRRISRRRGGIPASLRPWRSTHSTCRKARSGQWRR